MKNKLADTIKQKKYIQVNRETPWAGALSFTEDIRNFWGRFNSKSKAKRWVTEQKGIYLGMVCRVDPDLSKVGHVLDVEYFSKTTGWTNSLPEKFLKKK